MCTRSTETKTLLEFTHALLESKGISEVLYDWEWKLLVV